MDNLVKFIISNGKYFLWYFICWILGWRVRLKLINFINKLLFYIRVVFVIFMDVFGSVVIYGKFNKFGGRWDDVLYFLFN